jgi:hypothetical protein
MFIDRGIFKQKTDVLDAAVELLVRHQMEVDSRKQAEEFKPDSAVLFAQEATLETVKVLAPAYAELSLKHATTLALLDEAEAALQRLLDSEALKEAPFYTYCESICDAKEFIEKLRKKTMTDQEAAEEYAKTRCYETFINSSFTATMNAEAGFLAGCAYGRKQENAKLEIALEALKRMIEPLPLDKNPKLTVSQAFDIFATRIGIGYEAVKQIEGKE